MNKNKVDLDWGNLPFEYSKTDYNIRFFYKDGKWSKGKLFSDDKLQLSIAAPCLHYGQECFEGIKAFETKDGRIVCFRPDASAKRLNHSCKKIFIPEIPENLFLEGIKEVINANKKFVPPYGTGASLYIRPVVFGTGARVGLGPAETYTLIIFVSPVGPYYKGGLKPVDALVTENYDRAAPDGTGDCKVGGNYAAGLAASAYAKSKGCPIALHIDPCKKKYIDEFSTSNFIAIKGNTYLTPKSHSILASITNDSLSTIAQDLGYKLERRPIEIAEIKDFDEIGAVGTAAVVTPIASIKYKNEVFTYCKDGKPKEGLTRLYKALQDIQYGNVEDKHDWLFEID